MIPKSAIEKAIAGGWKKEWREVDVDSAFIRFTTGEFNVRATWMLERIALDPSFWQGLGKALGWQLEKPYEPYIVDGIDFGLHEDFNEWHVRASKFYDLIITGEDTDKYWNDILGA